MYDITDRYRYVFLSRPRRFGKSLLTSTLESYFKGEKELFKGLAIEKQEKDWIEYPVFRFDFSGNNFNEPERLIGHIKSYLDEFDAEFSIHTEGYISVRLREEAWSQFLTKYDGYHFSSVGEGIYNPYSVINAFDENELDDYWFETGSPSYLIRMIERNSYRLDSLDGQRRTKLQLSDISDSDKDFVPLLFQSGYLTIKDYDPVTSEYTLGFPNKEVVTAFWNSLSDRFFKGMDGTNAFNLRKCLREVNEGKPEEFMQSMRSLFADTNSEQEKDKEIHFQNMMAIAAKMMGFTVRTEIHSAKGRCDMQILTTGYVYIFEFKIDGTPEEAMEQIYEKGYAVPFEADPRAVYLIGANFSTADRTLDGWIIKKNPRILLFFHSPMCQDKGWREAGDPGRHPVSPLPGLPLLPCSPSPRLHGTAGLIVDFWL